MCVDADFFEEWCELLKGCDLSWRDVDGDWCEEALRFDGAFGCDAFEEDFEDHAFVECMLIDDDDALLVLRDDVGIVDLENGFF